jgi:hypothetical protein
MRRSLKSQSPKNKNIDLHVKVERGASMRHAPSDTITWSMMLRKLPMIAKAIPRVVKGMKAANVNKQPCAIPTGRRFCMAMCC